MRHRSIHYRLAVTMVRINVLISFAVNYEIAFLEHTSDSSSEEGEWHIETKGSSHLGGVIDHVHSVTAQF